MPPMKLQRIFWGTNTAYATRRATMSEIEEVLLDTGSAFRRNMRGRAATHLARGRTADGRRITVAFVYHTPTRTAIPINAWSS